jgi:tetratricopeptide (TPR) repeat protein
MEHGAPSRTLPGGGEHAKPEPPMSPEHSSEGPRLFGRATTVVFHYTYPSPQPFAPPPGFPESFPKAGPFKEQCVALENRIVAAPDDPIPYIVLGDIALRKRRFVEAELLYRRADELVEKSKEGRKDYQTLKIASLSGLAGADAACERWEAARQRLEEVLKLDPKDAATIEQLARATFFGPKDARQALELLKRAAQNSPRLVPFVRLAFFYEVFPDPGNASRWISRAVEKEPGDPRTQLAAAQWVLLVGTKSRAALSPPRDARSYADKALELDPQSIDAQLTRGTVALFDKDYAKAEGCFEVVLKKEPENCAARNNLALTLGEQTDAEKKKRAVQLAEANFDACPDDIEARATLAWALFNSGAARRADELLLPHKTSGELTCDMLYYMARIANARGRVEEAGWLVRLALKGSETFRTVEAARALEKELREKWQRSQAKPKGLRTGS